MGVNIQELNQAQQHFLDFMLPSLTPAPDVGHVRFAQVGANIGAQAADPIHKFVRSNGWKGMMIEPLPHIFAKLEENMAGIDGVTLVNKAISDSYGDLTLYYPENRTELASFDKNVVISHGIPENQLTATTVPKVPLSDLLIDHNMTALDLLVVDAEGHDAAILKSVDFDKIAITSILFEIKHLAEADLEGLKSFLTSKGYLVILMGADGFAVKPNPESRPFFELLQGIFDPFRKMERRSMHHLQLIMQTATAVLNNTPRN